MTKRLYGYKWQQARAKYLAEHPLCVRCHSRGRITPATVVDHIEPHRGDPKLFWRRSNWQALCKRCHDSWKQRLERTGREIGCDESGIPLDPNHHWHRQG